MLGEVRTEDDNLEVTHVELIVAGWMREILQGEPNTEPTGTPRVDREDQRRLGEELQGDREEDQDQRSSRYNGRLLMPGAGRV